RIEDGDEVRTRRDEERHPVALLHAGSAETRGELTHALRQELPRHDTGSVTAWRDHVDHSGVVAALQFVEVVPERGAFLLDGSGRQLFCGADAIAQPGEDG